MLLGLVRKENACHVVKLNVMCIVFNATCHVTIFFFFSPFSGITLLLDFLSLMCEKHGYVTVELCLLSLCCNTAPFVVMAACSCHIELNYLVMLFVCTSSFHRIVTVASPSSIIVAL